MTRAPWKPLTRIDVFYQDDGDPERVGGLVLDENTVTNFQYDLAWLNTARELSPQQLPCALGRAVVAAPDKKKLHGLHGLFADSLPDDWGWRVMDSAFRRHGITAHSLSVLDRLAYLGDRAMGALSYRPSLEWPAETEQVATLDALAREAATLDEGRSRPPGPSAIDQLERAAGTPGGAQPKVLYHGEGKHYLLKFTPERERNRLRKDCGQIEQAYARMAHDAGLDMPATRLFATTDARLHFAAERFDRTPSGGRRHVHTLGGLLGREASDNGDYDELLRVARGLTGDARTLDEVFRRLCFNVMLLNDDDHLKNVAFRLDPREGWQLAPAYDLTYSPSVRGERGMSIDGREGGVTWGDVDTLATTHGVKRERLREMREAVEGSIRNWEQHASDAQVPSDSITELKSAFSERAKSLAL